MLDEGQLINLISNIGFPIAVSIYLLLRFEKKIEGLEQTIQKLATEVELIKNKE
ncbi:YvrJ family protein [Ureibacillus sp. 179-F W5.1 NHS]|uniref:YvrJ family protein n=1 Tax=Lysinibacillus halotolerans TaxID=1368476 RepID=A0A3M8HCJ4_9BACI|nr:YvrJ family protein [Lysinibacillus halotolerans]RND00082.1 YvrJ family protein [Lysinibacillus halotolerans]